MSSDDPFSDAEHRASVARRVAARRVRRRLKAAASIGLALMAGAFLACTPDKKDKPRVPVPPNPTTPSMGALPPRTPSTSASESGAVTAPSGASAAPDGGAESDAGPAASPTGSNSASSALVPVAKTPHKAPSVDKQEHRKGMPVPDNLLE